MRAKIRQLFCLLAIDYNYFSNRGSSNQCLYGMGDKRAYFKKGSVGKF